MWEHLGSSPLTRGKRARNMRVRRILGLIPAHAGKTSVLVASSVNSRAHPRSRGENGTRSDLAYVTEGSSPLTRGKPLGAVSLVVRGRAHPRSRGENIEDVRAVPTALGSSPLTRGKRSRAATRSARAGLIPAHAGKTTRPSGVAHWPWAHPRSRGENQVQVLKAHLGDGSSPLTRGKPLTGVP